MLETKRPLSVFLCHASNDKQSVIELYKRLVEDGVDAWLDKEKLIPGQDWRIEISKAVKQSDVVIVCLSNQSTNKEGFVQKELRLALDVADEKPDGTIFIIPARLENCEVPYRLSNLQWVDIFSNDGYKKLLTALQIRANSIGKTFKPEPQNAKKYIDTIEPVFLKNKFEQIQFPGAERAFYKAKSFLGTIDESYFIFQYADKILLPSQVQSISQQIFQQATVRHQGSTVYCYPVIIVQTAPINIREFIKSYNPPHIGKTEFPVIVELSSSNLYYYKGYAFFGLSLTLEAREQIESLLRLPTKT